MESIVFVKAPENDISKVDLIEIGKFFKSSPEILAEMNPEDAPILGVVNLDIPEHPFELVARVLSPEYFKRSRFNFILKGGSVCEVDKDKFKECCEFCTRWNASLERQETWRKAVEFAKKVIA